ncbi:MAG: biopolymer transporter ExbD [Vampirovibrionales bacterium]|nr:biopolymer transporter ExbD [Vampirovibrionales bacterium]
MARVTTVFDEINITPLTDIFLVLLIIMMVVAPLMQSQRADIQTPDLTAGKPLEPEKMTVEVTAQGAYYVNGLEASKDNLASLLQDWVKKHPATRAEQSASSGDARVSTAQTSSQTLVLRADKQTKSEQIMAVFEAARDAGFKKLTVAGVPAQSKQTVNPEPAL